jgi:RNA polymerase sigma-70 factor, ECF subfamily
LDGNPPPPGPPGDRPRTALQQRVDQGEEQRVILEELYRSMQVSLRARANRWLKDARLAEDLVQAVFLKMHIHFAEMIAREPVEPWVLRVARNQFLDWERRRRARGGNDLLAEPDPQEEPDERSAPPTVENQVEMWVGTVEPLLVHLRALVATGLLSEAHLRAFWYGVAEGVTQQELARDLGVSQGQISNLKTELQDRVRGSFYLCEILGLVRPPHREAAIRSHLGLAQLATGLTADDRILLWRAGSAVRMDHDWRPELRPKDARAAIEKLPRRTATLDDLHQSESAYAAAIPNPTPRCIANPCALHTAADDPKA